MKGFTHVLEGVLAAFLLIGAVTTVVPNIQVQQSSETDLNDRLWNRLESMDRTDTLRSNLEQNTIEEQLSDSIPSEFNTDVSLIETYNEKKRYEVSSGSIEKKFNISGEDFEIQLWLESADNINVSFDGKRLLTEISEEGYYLRPLDSGKGNLTVNGTGTVFGSVNGFKNRGAVQLNNTVQSVKYLDAKDSTVQIGVFTWE